MQQRQSECSPVESLESEVSHFISSFEESQPTEGGKAEEDKAAALRADRLKEIMRRVVNHPNFASTSSSIMGIQSVARSDNSHVRMLTAEISDDIAISAKLLRLVNAAFYKSVGGGSITSMKRAVELMGFESIGRLASSLKLFESLPKGSDGNWMRQEFGRAQFAAMLAHEMCNERKHIDDAFMTALFHNLGGMLGGMHFPEEIQKIEAKLNSSGLYFGDPIRHETRERLAKENWGIGIEDLGIEVAKQWGWPEKLVNNLRSIYPSREQPTTNPDLYLRILSTAANQLANELLGLPVVETRQDQSELVRASVENFSKKFAIPLGIAPDLMVDVVERTKSLWDELAKEIGLGPKQNKPRENGDSELQGIAPKHSHLKARPITIRPLPDKATDLPTVEQALQNALEKAKTLVQSGATRSILLQFCMQNMLEALQLQRVILCLGEPGSGVLQGKMGLGLDAQKLSKVFLFPTQPASDLFGLLCLKGSDILISNASDPAIAKRLPSWFKQVNADTFVLLPMLKGKQVFGAIYGDRTIAGSLVLDTNEMALLKAIRNQILLALQSGK